MIGRVFHILIVWKYFIFLSAIFCCLVAAGVASTSSPIYQSVARVQVDIGVPNLVTGAIVENRYAEAYMGSQAEIVRDYGVAGRVVDAAGLLNSPQMAAEYRARHPDQSIDFRRWLAQQIIAGTVVGSAEESDILEIRYLSGSPATAAAMAELIRTAYIDHTLASQRERARSNADWFEQEALALRDRLTAAQTAKTQFERENDVIITSDGQSVEEIRVAVQATTLPSLRPSNRAPSPPPPSASALAEIQARISAAANDIGPNHPAMLQLRQQEASLRAAVEREQAALNAQSAASGALSEPSRAPIDRMLTRADEINEARRLTTNVNLLQEQYRTTAKRAADLRLEAGSLEAGLTPLGTPSVPSKPLAPNWPVILGVSLGFGFVLACLTALFLELLRLPVRSADDLDLEGIPLLNAGSGQAREPTRQARRARSIPLMRFFRERQGA